MDEKELIPGIPNTLARKILGVFASLPAGERVILFGSRAKGTYREGSDIDIAITGDVVTLSDRDTWFERYHALELPWKLDLVLYRLITEPALKEHIDRVGRVLLGNG